MSSFGTDVLSAEECAALLSTQRVGRVAVDTGERPAILPVLYAVLDGDVVFRTAPGEKLVAAALHRTVAFETDAYDLDAHTGWSVDVVGKAEELVGPDDRERAASLGLEPWAGPERDRYVRIRAEHVSGRRVRDAHTERVPVAFEGPPDERAGLSLFLDEQRAALLRKFDGLTDEQATHRPVHSAFCMLTLVKHVAFVERRWFQLEVARRDVPGLWPPPDDRELRLEPGDTVATITALYTAIIDENRAILDEVIDLDSCSATGVNRRWVLLHLIEELARHAGHGDIIREEIDGLTGP